MTLGFASVCFFFFSMAIEYRTVCFSHHLPHLRCNLKVGIVRGKLELVIFFLNPGNFLIYWVGHIGILCKAFFPSAHFHFLLKLTYCIFVCESLQSFIFVSVSKSECSSSWFFFFPLPMLQLITCLFHITIYLKSLSIFIIWNTFLLFKKIVELILIYSSSLLFISIWVVSNILLCRFLPRLSQHYWDLTSIQQNVEILYGVPWALTKVSPVVSSPSLFRTFLPSVFLCNQWLISHALFCLTSLLNVSVRLIYIFAMCQQRVPV